ncbi:MAG: NADH-quinone oxidoreductase subunit H, partial [Dehalococcoidia bacterium]|nr:NADH-quinone oxidoreductase subunit H [Dehalococcoidia bacterium]
MVMGFIYLERRGIGRFQVRLGPNRAGPFGALQPVADVIKILIKEDIIPAKGDRWVHWLAPVVAFVPLLMIFAVVPFHDGALLVDLNIGILFVVAISSVSVVGIFMAGWGSNNKFSLLGAMRTVAQVVSYEIPVVLSIVGVVLITGSLSMSEIVEAQNIPFILLQPLGFLIYFIGACAEINRTPFDLMEAESEIVAGYHTEYSGIKFALFYLVEYTEALAISAIV